MLADIGWTARHLQWSTRDPISYPLHRDSKYGSKVRAHRTQVAMCDPLPMQMHKGSKRHSEVQPRGVGLKPSNFAKQVKELTPTRYLQSTIVLFD